MDMTEAEYVETDPKMQLHKVVLNILNDDDRDSIFNVIILEEDKDNTNGQ